MRPNNTIVLLSGGLDSCVCLAWAIATLADRDEILAVHMSYGQTHKKEKYHAASIAGHYGVPLEFLHLNFGHIEPSVVGHLLKDKLDPEAARQTVKDSRGLDVSATFVPGRNIIFLAYAGSIADASASEHIVIGVNAVDYSGYPDCRPRFIEAMQSALVHGLRRPVKLHAPLITMSKAEIIQLGVKHNAPLGLSWSCYTGDARPCGRCPSCLVREKGFQEAGVPDPALT